MFPWIVAAVILLLVHEAGHVLTAQSFGGRFMGFSRRGLAIGVRLDLDRLGRESRLWTVWGGPLAEAVAVVGVLLAISTGSLLPVWGPPISIVAALDLAVNLIPWWRHNDGARILAWHRDPAPTLQPKQR
jgi:hypothetical protein